MSYNFSISSILSSPHPTPKESNHENPPHPSSLANIYEYQTLISNLTKWQNYNRLYSPIQQHNAPPEEPPKETPLTPSPSVLLPPHWSQKQQGHDQGVLRRRYTQEQTRVLTEKYKQSRYVPRHEMALLASATGLSMLQVKIWFQNRRLKDRKKIQKSRSSSPELDVGH